MYESLFTKEQMERLIAEPNPIEQMKILFGTGVSSPKADADADAKATHR
jgi:hypothetical protein